MWCFIRSPWTRAQTAHFNFLDDHFKKFNMSVWKLFRMSTCVGITMTGLLDIIDLVKHTMKPDMHARGGQKSQIENNSISECPVSFQPFQQCSGKSTLFSIVGKRWR